ncbi:MAG: PAS domain S-box protein [Thermoleophilia bacterium]
MVLESEECLRKLVEKSPVAMLVASGEKQQVILVNEKFTELFGYTLEDVPDVEHWWPLAYPDEKYRDEVRAEWLTKIGISLRTGNEIEAMETAVTCRDGSDRYIKTHFSPIGTGARSLVTFFDVTERRRERQDLSDTERRYRQVLESSRDGFVVVASGQASVKDRGYPFIKKPYTLKGLLRIIGEILGG